MIELRILGTIDLRDSFAGRPIQQILAQPKRLAILTYLAVAKPHSAHRRDKLLAMFWPESSEERARNSLNQAVFNLRRLLGESAVVGNAEDLALNANEIWCDATAFEERLDAADPPGALPLYAGDLLPGFHLADCVEFERWLDSERERLRRRAVGASLDVTRELEQSGNEVGALELLHRVAEWSPYDQPVMSRLVAMRAALGDAPGALQDYERFREFLRKDLDMEPSAELQSLVASIRSGTLPAAAPVPPVSTLPGDMIPAPHARVAAGSPLRSTHLAFSNRVVRVALAAVILIAIGAGMRSLLPARGQSRLAIAGVAPPLDQRRVLVAAFENRTGHASLDPLGYMAADWIVQGLAQTGIARAVPFSTIVQETPHLRAEGAAPEMSTRAANRQLAQRIGAGLLLVGAYYHTGNQVAFQTQIIDVSTGELVRSLDEIRAPPEHPALAVLELQRRSLGALSTFYDHRMASWPDPGGQPSSLQAYELYSEGMSEFMRGMNLVGSPEGSALYRSAAARFMNAARLDSMFVTPMLWAGYAYMNAGDMDTAASLSRSLDARPLSAWSRAVLDHQRAALARDTEAEYRAASRLAELSPDSEWLLKLGMSGLQTGRAREALEVFLRMNPDRGWLRGWTGYWMHRAELQHIVGDYAAALSDARTGLRHAEQSDMPERQRNWMRTQELWALAALGRTDEMLDSTIPRLQAGDVFALWQLNTTMHELHAHRKKAEVREVLRRVIPLARRMVADNDQPIVRGHLAYLLYLAGEADESLALYDSLLKERPGSAEFRVRHAILSAKKGDVRPAGEVATWLAALDGDALARAAPQREVTYWGSLEAWRVLAQARLLAQTGDLDGAVDIVRNAIARGLRHTYLHLHDDPDFDALRKHSRFQELLRPKG